MNILKKVAVAAHKLFGGQRMAIKTYDKALASHQLLFNDDSQTQAKSMRDFAVFTTSLMLAIIPPSVVGALLFYRDFETVEKVLFALISSALLYTWICIDAGKARAANKILILRGGDNEQH